MLTIFLMVIFIGGPSWFFWIMFSPLWYGQKRWVVWYPPDECLRITGTFRADWSVPLTHYTAKNYANIFGGTVYRIR